MFWKNRNGNALTVEVEDDCKIVYRDCNGAIARTIPLDRISSVGYMTLDASIFGHDYFLLVNAEDTTCCIPVEWPNADAVIRFLSDRLPSYNAQLGLANVVSHDTLTVWPRSKEGDKFTFLQNVYPLGYNLCAI